MSSVEHVEESPLTLCGTNRRNEFLLSLWIVLVAVPFTAIFPFLIVFVLVPIKLYSRFIEFLAHLMDPDMGAMLKGLPAGQIRDIDDIYDKPRGAEVVCIRLKGLLDYDQILQAFHDRVINKLDDSKSHTALHYAELQQYFTKFCGYVFLKKDRTFSIKNHFTFYNESSRSVPVTRQELLKIWEALMVKPFPKKRSAWELIIIDNYQPDKEEIDTWNSIGDMDLSSTGENYFIIFVRMHHGLADGFSVQKMLSYLTDEVFRPQFSVKQAPLQHFKRALRAATLGPYDIIWRWYRGRESYHSLHLPPTKQSGDYFVIESNLISTERVKDIRDKYKVPFTTVLVAAISGGMRRYFQKYGISIPSYFSAGVPFATPAHTDKLKNEFLLTTVEYAVHLSNPKARVDYVQQKMNLLVTTSWIQMFNLIIDTYGTLPMPIFKRLTEKQVFSSTYSTQPGPTKCVKTFNSTMLEVDFSYGVGADSTTYGISTLTYNGYFRMVLFMEKNAVESRTAAEDIIKFISEEFDILENYQSSGTNAETLESEEHRQQLYWKNSVKQD